MADISKEIRDFREAVYGEEVRGSMISLAEKVNTESTAAKEAAVNMAEMAAEAVSNAKTAVENANEAVNSAENTAKTIQEAAERGDFSSTVSVEDVVTARPGEMASVENVGTEKDARFRFVIPKGEKGKDGTSINIKGKADSVDQLPEGAEPNASYIIGENIYVWDGTQWRDMGKLQGPPGEPATIKIGRVTEGESASVENAGTENNVVLNFVLPKGKDGASVGLGEPEISVDSGIGDPYAEVSASGPDTAKVLRFEFHNLKGEPGTKGAIDENASVTFSTAENRENIKSGETLAVILGKLEKIISTLKEVAFSGGYKDLTGAPNNVSEFVNDAKYVSTDTLKDNYVSKSGDSMTGSLSVPTLILGSEPSDKVGAMWIE